MPSVHSGHSSEQNAMLPRVLIPAAVTEEFWPPRWQKKVPQNKDASEKQKMWEGIGEDAYETDSLSRARTSSIRAGICNSYQSFLTGQT